MSMDAFPILLADEVAMSTLCRNSLTGAQVNFAEAALRHLAPTWSLDCHESCDADLFLDLCTTLPNGALLSFIVCARDGAIQVFEMHQDDTTGVGSFACISQAVYAVIGAIGLTLK
jgi:hypothetical protein